MQNTVGDVGTFTGEGETLTGTVVFVGDVKNEGPIILVKTSNGDVWMLKNDGTLFTKTGESSAAGGRRRKSRSTRGLGSRRRSLRRRGV